jgi:pilus assembly protein CpaF
MIGVDAHGKAQGAFYATGYRPIILGRMAGAGQPLPEELFEARELEMRHDYDAV